MSRIRKQPRRSTKKVSQPITKNIFQLADEYESVIPVVILSKLKMVEQISVNNLEQFIPQPVAQQLLPNLAQMRQALTLQRKKISSLSIHQDFERMQQMQIQQQIRQDTKKTAHSVHQYQASEMMMLNSEDDNIFFHDFGDQRRGPSHTHEDLMEMEVGIGVNEEIDILSMIN